MNEADLRRIIQEEVRNAGMLSTTEGNAPPNDQEAELDVLTYCYDNKICITDAFGIRLYPEEFFSSQLQEIAAWALLGFPEVSEVSGDAKLVLGARPWVSPEQANRQAMRVNELHLRRRFIRRMRSVEMRLRCDEIDVAKAKEMLGR